MQENSNYRVVLLQLASCTSSPDARILVQDFFYFFFFNTHREYNFTFAFIIYFKTEK